MAKTQTIEVTIRQLMLSAHDGLYGTEGTQLAGGAYAYGLPLRQVIGRPLGDGTRVRVTVEILDEQPLRVNSWLSDLERRPLAEIGAEALRRSRSGGKEHG